MSDEKKDKLNRDEAWVKKIKGIKIKNDWRRTKIAAGKTRLRLRAEYGGLVDKQNVLKGEWNELVKDFVKRGLEDEIPLSQEFASQTSSIMRARQTSYGSQLESDY
eukprot:UN05473